MPYLQVRRVYIPIGEQMKHHLRWLRHSLLYMVQRACVKARYFGAASRIYNYRMRTYYNHPSEDHKLLEVVHSA